MHQIKQMILLKAFSPFIFWGVGGGWGGEWKGGKLLCSQINFLVYLPVQLHECHCQHEEGSKMTAKLKCLWTAIFRYERISMITLLILLCSRF